MSDENINVIVKDSVDATIAPKFVVIANTAVDAGNAIVKLQAAIALLDAQPVNRLAQAVSLLASAMSALSSSSTQLNQVQAQSAQQAAATATAQANLARATSQAATAASQATAAQAAAATAAARAAAQLATAQGQAATAAARAAAAQSQAAQSALALQQAQARAQQGANGLSSELGRMATIAAELAATYFGAKELADAADAYTLAQNKVRSLGTEEADLGAILQKVADVAVASHTSFEDTVTTYQRMSVAIKDLGLSSNDAIAITKTLQESVASSGATTSAARAGLYQLAEGLEANNLQGIHLKALIVDLPQLARQLATALGTTISGLRTMGTQGKLTADVLIPAIQSIAPAVDATSQRVIPTLSQAFTDLGTRFTIFVGETNSALGATKLLSTVIETLANHIPALIAATAVLGVALAFAFGPALVAGITAVTGAVVGLTVAFASNPIGLVVTAISAIVAVLFTYRNDIKDSTDKTVTFGNQVSATFNIIVSQVAPLINTIKTLWSDAIGFLATQIKGFPTNIDDALKDALAFIATTIPAITILLASMPAIIEDVVTQSINTLSNIGNALQNLLIDKVNGLRSALNSAVGGKPLFDLAPNVEASVLPTNNALDKYKDQIATKFATIKKQIEDGARNISVNNALQGASTDANLAKGGAVVDHGPSPAELKAAAARALALTEVNQKLDDQTKAYGLVGTARTNQLALDSIEESLTKKKISLTGDETAGIVAKIAANTNNNLVQEQMNQIYTQFLGPAQNYQSSVKAANDLLANGTITIEQYNQKILQSQIAYSTATNPLAEFNRGLDQEAQLLQFVGQAQTVAQQIQSEANNLRSKGLVLGQQDAVQEADKLARLNNLRETNQALNQIYAQTQGAQIKLTQEATALTQAYQKGYITADKMALSLQQIKAQQAQLNLDNGKGNFADVMTASLGRLTATYKGVLPGLSNAFGDFFTSLEDGFAQSIGKAVVGTESLSAAIQDVASQALEALIAALVKVGLQYLINAALGNAAQASTLAATVPVAAATAEAWATAAALASLATLGSNSVPATAALGETTAFAQVLALGSAAGFMTGGYTGDGGISQIAGVVHGKEFVSNAGATSANRSALEAANRGAKLVAVNSNASNNNSPNAGGIKVEVHNYSPGTSHEVQQVDANTIRLIARQEANNAVDTRTDGVVSSHISNPNSRTSKTLARSTNTQRNRS